MKKALALVLALVLALSLGVVAFADTLDVVTLVKAPEAGTDLIPLNKIDLDANKVVIAGEGGTYHFVLDPSKEYENVVVTGNGVVAAKVLDYDPEVYEDIGNIRYYVYNVATQHKCNWVTDYNYFEFLTADEIAAGPDSYKFCKAAAEALNKAEHKTNWVVKTDDNVNVVEITIADNYSAAYKEGTLKIEAKEVFRDAEGKVTKKVAVSASVKLVRDVVIFGYEEVKWAAKYGEALLIGSNGYSDYKSAVKGYKTPTLDDPEIVEDGAVVVSTTEFRAIEGQDLKVAARDRDNYVTIKSVAAGQKGVNFSFYGYDCYDANGKLLTAAKRVGNTAKVAFGFYGDQVIASDFTITLDPEVSYFELRELFGKKVEEEDIITYYILKDGKLYDQFTVDYMKVDPNEEIELVINGKAGSTLGQYELVLEVPAAPSEGEENPNTGAESVIGVVAAMAVVSVAAAAAVSLKK